MAVDSIQKLRDIENRLSQFEFRGVPIGSALAALLYCELFPPTRPWPIRNAAKDWVRFFYHHAWVRKASSENIDFCHGRVLVTCHSSHFRYTNLIFPVAEQLGYDRCALFYGRPPMANMLPRNVVEIDSQKAIDYYNDRRAWRRDYFRLWKALRPVVKQMSREIAFPRSVYYRLADAVVTCTQWIAGCQEFLRRAEPVAIVTEFDRNDLWAPLVLSAKVLGIPTYTLMHGVMGDHCAGFYPLLADKIFCWGEISANAMVAEGVEPSRILIGGCPRLTRDLPLSAAEARTKMGLDPEKPLVVLATQNFSWPARLLQAEVFCKAVAESKDFTGIVRLHPVDKLRGYADVIARYPSVRFQRNTEYSLDDMLAAADIVVMHSSGSGSDALVKRRLAVVLDACDEPLGHGRDLIELAHVPHATSVETLLAILRQLLFDEQEREKYRRSAEDYVRRFCAYFGEDSAKRIAEVVLHDLESRPTAHRAFSADKKVVE